MKHIVWLLLITGTAAWATVSTPTYSVTYTCTGTTGPYAFTFPISDPTALTVTKAGILLASSAYTVTPVNNNYANGGSVTLSATCTAGSSLVLARVTPLTQATHYYDNMPIPMSTFERSLDKLTEITQEQWGKTTHSVTIQGVGTTYPAVYGGNLTLNFINCTVSGLSTGVVPDTENGYNITCPSASTGSFTNLSVSTLTLTNPGVFTNTQMNEYLTSNVGGAPGSHCGDMLPPLFGGTNYFTDALSGCLTIPSTSTVLGGAAVAGYTQNASTTTAGISSFGLCQTVESGATCVSSNFGANDTAGKTGQLMTAMELDWSNRETSTTGAGLDIVYGYQVAQSTNAIALEIRTNGDGAYKHWTGGLVLAQGSTDGKLLPLSPGISLGPSGPAPNQPSQFMQLVSFDTPSGSHTGYVQQAADGSLDLTFQKDINLNVGVGSVNIPKGNGDLVLGPKGAGGGPDASLSSRPIVFVSNDASSVQRSATEGTDLNGQMVLQTNIGAVGGTANNLPVLIIPDLSLGTGMTANSPGFKHKRGTSGCATTASAGDVCTTVVSWVSGFGDTNYTATCSGVGIASGVPLSGGITAKATGSVTFQTVAMTAAAAQYTTIECIAVHD